MQRRKKANDRGQGRGAVAAGLKKAVERRTYIIFITVFVIILHDGIESRNRAIIHTSETVAYDLGVCFGSGALRVYLRTMRKLNALAEWALVFQEDRWIAWLHVNREEEEQEEGEEEEEEGEEGEEVEKTKNGIAGATTGAGVGLPLLLLVVALLDDLTHVTTAASVILEPLNSVHPGDSSSDAPTPVYLPPRLSSDYYLFAPRPFRRAIKRASSPNDVGSDEDLSILTPSRDNENEGIVARRGRAKRVAISKRSKLKDQPSPNFIDPWPEAWRRANEHPPQSRKVEPGPSIDERIRPAVQTFTPLLEPVFKLGGSILRPESSLRDILLRESASKTTATTTTTTTAVATRTITRNIVYLDATQHARSTVSEKNDVERVTEDRVKGDKRGKELVLVGNEDNGAVVVGGGSVIEWTTTTVAGPMSSSRSAFSGDNVQVAERVRVRVSSERSSSKGEQDDEEQRSTGQFPSVLGWLCRVHVTTYISGIRGWYDALRVVATAAGRLPQNRAKEALRAKSERASSLWKPWLFDYCGVPQVFYGLNDRKGKGISKNRYTDLDTRHLAPPRRPPCNTRHPSGHGPYVTALRCFANCYQTIFYSVRYHSKYSALKTFYISRLVFSVMIV
ncbi:hypothetical protein ALC56_14361 [Trachymyrmex septentrionalis]|uniref:Uncharacterized protein n=1 Tax=Trachymyrmex septentrionalis TaxID=34720 RepID=A0A195ETA2_9HYME|nr:hypothetical protein ALC56_14361 [Trachymyrmex septentrionalis]